MRLTVPVVRLCGLMGETIAPYSLTGETMHSLMGETVYSYPSIPSLLYRRRDELEGCRPDSRFRSLDWLPDR